MLKIFRSQYLTLNPTCACVTSLLHARLTQGGWYSARAPFCEWCPWYMGGSCVRCKGKRWRWTAGRWTHGGWCTHPDTAPCSFVMEAMYGLSWWSWTVAKFGRQSNLTGEKSEEFQIRVCVEIILWCYTIKLGAASKYLSLTLTKLIDFKSISLIETATDGCFFQIGHVTPQIMGHL